MLGVGLLLQVLTYLMTKDTLLSFVSGISGVFAVVFCSERKFSYYFWSFLQLTTFSIICFNENLYGKLVENAFYLIKNQHFYIIKMKPFYVLVSIISEKEDNSF